MMKISFHVPDLNEYGYEQQLESDPLSMSYNAGYDVSYPGYHYDSGCIDFPEERWQATFDRRVRENRFFAYIRDDETKEYVGDVNYQYNRDNDRYECGVLIDAKYRGKGYGKAAIKLLCETAKENGVKELYDEFEADRGHVLKLFESCGFVVCEEKKWKKFDSMVNGVTVVKKL